MTLDELQILLDISIGNETEVLKQYAHEISCGYLFVDSSNGQCYLLNEHGHLDDISKVKNIGNYAFYDCISLESIIIPNSIESIGECAFEDCTSLKSIIIPDSVKSIGDYAFVYCTSLESITISNSIKNIEKGAFYGCTSLKNIINPRLSQEHWM